MSRCPLPRASARSLVNSLSLLGVVPALALAPAWIAPSEAGAHAAKPERRGGAHCGAKRLAAKHKTCKNGAGAKNALVTLTDPATGFTVQAPNDFTVTHTAGGVEHVASATRGAFVNYLLVAGSEAPAKVAQTLIAQSASSVSSSTQTAGSFTAAIVHAGHAETFEVRQVGSGSLAITAWGATSTNRGHGEKKHGKRRGKHSRRAKHRARKASLVRAAAAEPIAPLLQRIAEGGQGGRTVPVPVQNVAKPVAPVALQSYANSDRSATAEVPAGFNCAGSRGIIECLDGAHGAIEFGVAPVVCVPGSAKAWTAENVAGESALCPAIANFIEDPTTAALTLWGPMLDRLLNAGISGVTLVSSKPVPFAPGWNASFDLIQFTRNGVPWEAAMIAAATPETGSSEEWLFYYSDVSAPRSGNSAYGQALAKSWASFNPSAAEGQRLAESEKDQQATTAIIQEVSAFRQEVFEEANENWDAYIRGAGGGTHEEVERGKEEIAEKAHEAIGRAKEEIEQQMP